ncbi:TPA: hypothetical protein DIV55_05580 [Patescibacteria group bacterium]|uniref:S-layer domain-containing protein n=1 Tax=Candidatus Gottesmanbacteria bacterium GW2011_GWA1_43_11 TaxID=1618436 RepID=A0A0G1CCB0_9BACT|nr:MAG: S-layer domain-containing protein [Candidatus Gottesmanbacteria bacterium GW2011_GWA1_43_11]HCS79179.1 hypothetical protein [Patescibacteria group bacterium]
MSTAVGMTNRRVHSFFVIFVLFLTLPLFFISHSFAQVVINEFSPFSDPEWVEFYNASESAEYIKGYYLQDNKGQKKLLSELNISNIQYPFIDGVTPWLNNTGDTVSLFDPNGTQIDSFLFDINYGNGLTFGRNPDKDGSFHLLESSSKGSKNSAIKSSPDPTPNISPTSMPSVSPSVMPSPVPTSSPSSKPTPKASPKRSSPSPQPSEEVLGTMELASPITQLTTQPAPPASESSAPVAAGIVVIIIGGTISGASGYWAYRLRVKNRGLVTNDKKA